MNSASAEPAFTLHLEDDFESAATFVTSWLETALPALSQTLGVAGPEGGLHVVLSSTDRHRTRFPIRDEEVQALSGPYDEEPIGDPRSGVLGQAFAHGVATRARALLHLPTGVPAGSAVICIDVPTVTELAEELGVTTEAMLARVLVHEGSHVLRGHIDGGGVTHGYIREGDAQSDAWQLLTDLLATDEHASLARDARVAQVRLAARQPPAYRRFGAGAPDTGRWMEDAPSPNVWVVRPSRAVLVLAQYEIVEVPVLLSGRAGRPRTGDRVVLADREFAVGEWVVMATSPASHASHPRDVRTVARVESEVCPGGQPPQWLWLHLRRTREAVAAAAVPDSMLDMHDDLTAMSRTNAVDAWADADKQPLAEATAELVARAKADHARGIADVVETMKAAGVEVPPGLDGPRDPLRD